MGAFMIQGGPFMYPTFGIGVIALGICLVLVKGAASARPHTYTLATGLMLWLVCMGCLGTLMGFINGFEVITQAPTDQILRLMAAVTSICIHPLALALMFLCVLLPLFYTARFMQSKT
jgi:hypothetical protein